MSDVVRHDQPSENQHPHVTASPAEASDGAGRHRGGAAPEHASAPEAHGRHRRPS
ncbi:hypothetical protein [Streptomyces genisteinicus]|uniref:Uncharacterized protein n=1 Tax=Streptomyces genisteinicus TaxID=2768068 RepID=A0A7H0HR96_9ACTN|nr:hypothetical protein [Streptomyces genisteinicus]QNP63062.1 hypothetical protein IAG43_09005 [Streptomyces genisteinicus]